MEKLILLLLGFVVIDYANGQCGCPRQSVKLRTRGLDNVKMGDMLLDSTDIQIINGFKNHYANSKKWPNNIVTYTFAGNFPQDKIQTVRQSLGELQKDLQNCVKFQEGRNGHYIEVNSKREGCYSMLGVTGGPSQPLNLENPGCMYSKGTIKHEFIHALGFMHTHMRKDRDNHITIKWDRILTSQCSQFTKCDGCEPDGPYETESVMHYNSEGFACNPSEKVVVKKNGGAIGYNHETTANDLQMIKNFYNCK
uniref:Metalloendopeptidase n=1 Tax=Schmidtea mediterranea TaxID=79327 RepID=A0A060Q714_SCHMD|nr:Ast2 protein [Schmidtea mediterranea]